jgi:hypothetical protein
MASTTTPTYAPQAADNVRAAATLNAAATANYDIDFHAGYGGWLHVRGTFGTVAGTNGLKIELFRRYGSTPTQAVTAWNTWIIPGTTSTSKDIDIPVPKGYWNVTITNLDATNALTNVGITSDEISNQATA